MLGMVAGVIIGITSDFFTGDDKKPVAKVAESCQNGPAFTILNGFSYGLLSCLPALIGIGLTALISYKLGEAIGPGYAMMGISTAAIGMLSIIGMIISNDAYGPIVDNARGVAEMAGLGDEVLEITDELDAAGNTAKAITKGFSIGAAGLTVISLLGAFLELVNAALAEAGQAAINAFDVMNPMVFFGILVGAAIPAVFSAMLMNGVNRNSQVMVKEIHRQFNSIPGLREGTSQPDYAKCIDISTRGAIRELIPAGLFAILHDAGGRLHRRPRGHRRLPRRQHRHRPSAGAADVQRRRPVGQRQEVRRGRQLRRQGLRRAQGGRHRRYRRRPLQGYRGPVHQHPDHRGLARQLAGRDAVRPLPPVLSRKPHKGETGKRQSSPSDR